MRLLRLDLIAFGPFTNALLDFSAASNSAPGLHLIYGPNEAGKTSARRALRTAFYGFPNKPVEFDFIHDKQALRVGATIENAAGTRSTFVRRRGTKNTLLGADGVTPLDVDPVAPFLAGVGSVDEFERSFAIGEAELRAGGLAIIQGEGVLSELLFMTAAGLPKLRAIERELAAKADELFKPSGKLPPINDALSRLKSLREEQRRKSLLSDDYIALERALAEARHKRTEVARESSEVRLQMSKLTRYRQALPIAARLKLRQQEFESLQEIPSLPEDFTERRERLQREASRLTGEINQLEIALKASREQLAALVVRGDVLEYAHEIDDYKERLGVHRKAAKDIGLRQNEIETRQREVRLLVQELSPDGNEERLRALQLSRVDQTAIRGLVGRISQLEERLEGFQRQAERLREHATSLDKETASLGPDRPLGPLQSTLKSARADGDLDNRIATLTREFAESEKRLKRSCESLPLWSGDTEALATLLVPDDATLKRFEKRFAEMEQRTERLAEDRAALEQKQRAIEQDLTTITFGGDVPTEDLLHEARDFRQTGWRAIRRRLDSEASGEDEAIFLKEDQRPLPEAFEAAVLQADEIADRLRREAERVERVARLKSEEQTNLRDLTRLQQREDQLATELSSAQDEWQQLWPFLQQPARSPGEMRSWCEQRIRIVELAETTASIGAELQDLLSRARRHEAAIAKCLSQQSPSVSTDAAGVSLASLIEQAERELEARHVRAARQRSLEEETETTARDLREAESSVARHQQELQSLRGNWGTWMERLNLPGSTSGDEVQTFLQIFSELQQKRTEIEALEARIEGMRNDAAAFSHDVQRVATAVEPALIDSPFEAVAQTLHDLLTEARRTQERRQDLQDAEQEQISRLAEKRQRATEITAELATMAGQAGTKDVDLLPKIEEQAARKRALTNEITELNDDLSKCSGGESLDVFIVELDGVDEDVTLVTLEQLAQRSEALDAEMTSAVDAAARSEQALSQMKGDSAAADTAAEAEAVLARLAGDIEKYAQLRIAARLLRDGRERYRQKSGNTVLDHASRLFSQLTCGSFAELKIDFGSNDEPTLLGVRAGTLEAVPTKGMSDGTADQLYLAMRLAGLHAWLDKHESMPFVVDDLLIHFDDERAAAALTALAELSRRTQVLFFTHHEHLKRLAQDVIAADVLHIHELTGTRGKDDAKGESSGPGPASAVKTKAAVATSSLF